MDVINKEVIDNINNSILVEVLRNAVDLEKQLESINSECEENGGFCCQTGYCCQR